MLNSKSKRKITGGGLLDAWFAIATVFAVVGFFFVDGAQQRNVAIMAAIMLSSLLAGVATRRRQSRAGRDRDA